jgi:hypothetical protein
MAAYSARHLLVAKTGRRPAPVSQPTGQGRASSARSVLTAVRNVRPREPSRRPGNDPRRRTGPHGTASSIRAARGRRLGGNMLWGFLAERRARTGVRYCEGRGDCAQKVRADASGSTGRGTGAPGGRAKAGAIGSRAGAPVNVGSAGGCEHSGVGAHANWGESTTSPKMRTIVCRRNVDRTSDDRSGEEEGESARRVVSGRIRAGRGPRFAWRPAPGVVPRSRCR